MSTGALILRLVQLAITGGAAYVGLVAETARLRGATLLSCDHRAAQVYERMGIHLELLA
jgi:hypothetical protein